MLKALSPKQWGDLTTYCHFYGVDRPDGSCIVYFDGVDDGEPCALSIAHRVGVPSELPLEIPASDRHGMAAMLLHEQPFGFTQKDVELLRALSESEQVLALADRIEALLP